MPWYIVEKPAMRKCITRIRLGTHGLRIETGRYGRNRVERNQRLCPLCNTGDIEDAYHFVLTCPALNNIRRSFISLHYRQRPSVFKFISLLSSDHRKTIINLGKYLNASFDYRKTAILEN